MRVAPVLLTGREIRLEPLREDFAADLFEAAQTPDLFTYFRYRFAPEEWTVEGFREFVRSTYQRTAACPFAIIHQASGKAIGQTCYLNIRPADFALEIGASWIGPAYQHTAVNPEAKFLLLRHAFETLGCIRLEIKTDSRNARSIRAIEKLGATWEGVLRKHLILPDGYIRDSVYYSILLDEWPGVKERLVARLGYTPGE
ncbi:MAG: GNAT family N-acetyltransferase [Anaerolineae bacterium]|nr:GNAT family N-acetyltransferase [Anaerolineae bacterium]